MEIISTSRLRSITTALFLVVVLFKAGGQTSMPDILLKNTIKEQLNYLEERTKIYEYYRAIREDMFQKVKGNISDTLSKAFGTINQLKGSIYALNFTIDSLGSELKSTKTSLEEITRTKNSIRVLGMEVNKTTYNGIMWLIIAGLAACLVIGFLMFKANLISVHNMKKELSETKVEFEDYRKSSREAREKMSMDHFNEIRRLKGG
jgi:hypothetical protein